MSDLYIVATPIGNLEDITFRAVRTLSEADLIAAEDTRQTKKLLDRYDIKTPMTSYHKFNIRSKTRFIIDKILEGKKVALVSDSGMPGISDPGYELIRDSVEQGIKIVPVPGPSAVVAALAASGLPTDKFIFLGFLRKKAGKRRKALKELIDFDGTIIIYESPFRVVKCLQDILAVFGEREVAAARELTKIYEEIVRGKVPEVLRRFEEDPPKGEFVILIKGRE